MSRSRSSFWSTVFGPILAVWILVISGGFAQAETTLSVEEFLGLRSKWLSLAGTTYQIEGR